MSENLKVLQNELFKELKEILSYWEKNTKDDINAGFIGEINQENKRIENAPKGLILNTRILWSFSAAANQCETQAYAAMCLRAYQYLKLFFKDNITEGLHWELAFNAVPINIKKYTIGQAYAILALSEYYLFSGKEEVKEWAISLYELIERKAYNNKEGSYANTLYQNGVKEEGSLITLGTHLHVLEGYSALYRIFKNEILKARIKALLEVLVTRFLNKNHHCEMELDADWNPISKTISYGHNAEVPWMLLEAAKVIGDELLISSIEKKMFCMLEQLEKEAITIEGSMMYAKEIASNKKQTNLHWWPQVEVMITYGKMYALTKDPAYIATLHKTWSFIKSNFKDLEKGEWFAELTSSGDIVRADKVSSWKSPYHITRMCLQMMKVERKEALILCEQPFH